MDKWILSALTFVSVVMVMPELGCAVSYCPPTWTHYQLPKSMFCYKYFGHKMSWAEAENRCKNYTICGTESAHLVTLGSAEEEHFIVQYWQDMFGPFRGERNIWIGYSKETTSSNDWKWITPVKKSSYTNWGRTHMALASKPQRRLSFGRGAGGRGQAKDADQSCVKQTSGYYGRPYWESESCSSSLSFICKMRAM